MAASAFHKLLVLEESVIKAMATNPNFVREFPFLRSVARGAVGKRTGCGSCNKRANVRVQTINAAKQQIVSMGKEKKARLKKLLRSEKVRVRLAANGKVTEYTF
jgi:hypothetical protein